MAATLNANGAAASGQQPAGIVQQYQIAATNSNVDTSTGVTPYDSGTILGTVPPGKAGLKLVSGVVQRAAQIVADGTAGAVGNTLTPTFNANNNPPTPPTGTLPSDGLSSFPGRE
jgi:hypothetical protein